MVPAVARPSPPAPPLVANPVLRPEVSADDATESAVPIVTKIMEWAKPLVLKARLEGKLRHGCSNLEDVPPLEWNDPDPAAMATSGYV